MRAITAPYGRATPWGILGCVPSLKHVASGARVELLVDQVIGRAPGSELRLETPKTSAQHARIAWRSDHWEVADLGSRNGTFVGGDRLAAGERRRLRAGDEIAFGDTNEAWQLVDDFAPGSQRVASLPETTEDRPAPPLLDELELRFEVSPDEEHVAVTIAHGRGLSHLSASNLHYLLLLLARRRAEDRSTGVTDSEAGWVYADDVCRQLKIDPGHLNVTVFRIRRQLERAGVSGAERVVERRRTTGQIRIGVRAFRFGPAPPQGSTPPPDAG